jgi:hypothetical protein
MDLLAVLDSKIAALKQDLETHQAARKLLTKERATKDGPFPKVVGSVKRKMSAKGRAAIAKAQRERWAKVKAAKKKG